MGRKRNQGKARKEAKVKALEEAKEKRRLKNEIRRKAEDSYEEAKKFRSEFQCVHGTCGPLEWRNNISCQFATTYVELFHNTVGDGNCTLG